MRSTPTTPPCRRPRCAKSPAPRPPPVPTLPVSTLKDVAQRSAHQQRAERECGGAEPVAPEQHQRACGAYGTDGRNEGGALVDGDCLGDLSRCIDDGRDARVGCTDLGAARFDAAEGGDDEVEVR